MRRRTGFPEEFADKFKALFPDNDMVALLDDEDNSYLFSRFFNWEKSSEERKISPDLVIAAFESGNSEEILKRARWLKQIEELEEVCSSIFWRKEI